MRTFIALTLPDPIRNRLALLQGELKKTDADVKWTAPENIHLTLKFIGETDEKTLNKVILTGEKFVPEKKSYYARLSTLGVFPKIHSPRIVWIGLSEGNRETCDIAQELERRLSDIGIPKEERSFTSHLTVGRVKSGRNKDNLLHKISEINSLENENLRFLVDRITVYKSTLTPKGPVYEAIKELRLAAI